MKIGSCLLLLASPDDPLASESIPLVAASGYDYAEASLARIYNLSDLALQQYQNIFDQNRLPVEVFNNAIPGGLSLIGPQADQAEISLYIQRTVALAQRMGVQLITMSGPNRRRVPKDFTWEQGFSQYVTFLKHFSDAVDGTGISLAIEPINHEEHGFISTIAGARQVIEAVGYNRLGVIVDTYHFFKENDRHEDLLAAAKDNVLFHIHYATAIDRAYPQEKDFSQVKAALQPLLEAGYTGRVSVEAYTTAPREELPVTCRLLHSL